MTGTLKPHATPLSKGVGYFDGALAALSLSGNFHTQAPWNPSFAFTTRNFLHALRSIQSLMSSRSAASVMISAATGPAER